MTTPFTYDFGYAWWVQWGHLAPLALFGGVTAAALVFGWRQWLVWSSGPLAVWSLAALLLNQFVFRINLPVGIPTPQFLASGRGEVVDVDAWAWLVSPHAMAHHRPADPDRWRSMLSEAGFDVIEQGTQPSSLHFLSRKRAPIVNR